MRNKFIVPVMSLLLVASFLFSCEGERKRKNIKPAAYGPPGEVIVLVDSTVWKGQVGQAFRESIDVRMPGILRIEPMFKIYNMAPSQFSRTVKYTKNLVVIMTLDAQTKDSKELQGRFSPKMVSKIKKDSAFYYQVRHEEFARGQETLYLFGNTQRQLAENIRGNAQFLRNLLNSFESKRMDDKLFSKKKYQRSRKVMQQRFGYSIDLPNVYQLAMDTAQFIWYRVPDQEIDKNIFVTYKTYSSPDQFREDSILAFRNAVCKKYLKGLRDNVYMVTETQIPPVRQEVSLRGRYAVENRGLWKLSNNVMGGSFVSYTLADPSQKRIYYIEGYVYSPDKKKRETLRELETILRTFRTKAVGKKQ
ncbi:MAG: DUF4837 family protein [Cytophagales bacterium]|nr:DUF4837 family protein [Cytophagales bacterium]